MKKAFTLAEVLITLGIIGVVAAITMPVLIQNQTHRETEVKLQKFYSVFNQALKRSQLDNAEMSTWDYSLSNNDFVNKYLKPYLQVVEVVENTKVDNSTGGTKYILADGTAFGMINNSYVYFYPKNPKRCEQITTYPNGVCTFQFNLDGDKSALTTVGYDQTTYKYNDSCIHCCGAMYNVNSLCTNGIVENGWKIPKDYPLKIKY